ncbi:hypothetical protein CCHL11_04773 [Colletotrichum chlorophyti]|uniref:Uncharacterized protein n=1 Tax=Colletotrichum chlorophyti TaxID=708187 RepID=A0A1Q8S1L6_9PEZI|nr:hypothetical protein CCHL11_04773 [Colletotrichum chlorophyti]
MSYPHDHPPAAPPAQPMKPVAARPRPRCSQPMPFDPEELSQKLAKVLADQKLHAERRRRARAEAHTAAALAASHVHGAHQPATNGSLQPGDSNARSRSEPSTTKQSKERDGSSSARPKSKTSDDDRRTLRSGGKDSSRRKGADGEKHHFIPQFAAAQFTRTTTAEGMSGNQGLVRKFSRTALRLAHGHRDRRQDNGISQQNRIPETADAEGDRSHNRERPRHRHTIQATGQTTQQADHATAARRVSTGDLLMTWDSGSSSPAPYHPDDPEVPHHDLNEHRVDWTQSDEAQPQQRKSKTALRKADSIWALKNRLGAFTKHGREEDHSSRETSPPSETLRSPKSGFFSRFKVNH